VNVQGLADPLMESWLLVGRSVLKIPDAWPIACRVCWSHCVGAPYLQVVSASLQSKQQ